MELDELSTPALVVDTEALEANLAAMADALPGARCRPHVKAHKTTELARRQRAVGHPGFTCATAREAIGLAEAGLGDDILIANEIVDPVRLSRLADLDARVTIAVDSEATIEAVASSGLHEVVVDVMVGLPRCGCLPDDAGQLAEVARARALDVRGVMGYEGHVVGVEERATREEQTEASMADLLAAHAEVGGELVSAGGTGTYDINVWATEIQAGSYALMDTAYDRLDLPFRRALFVSATVISVLPEWAVADCGLKALGMDHGNPSVEGGTVLFCSDEHLTFVPDGGGQVRVGERVRVWPAHVDPTIAYHEQLALLNGREIVDRWPIDLRGW